MSEQAREFFEVHYRSLRPHVPMKWMERMFARIINGKPPALVDLPTGAGKTELIVIWLLALAWFGKSGRKSPPVPRRLVWVVNRRVLVQQVYDVAERLDTALKAKSGPAAEFGCYLRSLCKQDSEAVFSVVQLRGQRLDDREWSLNPTVPQLIIGTVDQIGSRLLFQGYGQGKWSRPMHAGLFGVDAWACIDEAHLVPAFAVTLRQIREMACRPFDAVVPEPVAQFFGRLPFWTTELSATPGLPPPKHGEVFRLENEDETDDVIADRLRAKTARRVVWKAQQGKKLADELATEALRIANETPGSAIAVFCREANDAEAIAKKLKEKHDGRVLLVTGRIRGYERDRLEENELFRRFREGHPETPAAGTPPTFLVGTAAAEVGLDADASTIVCDFADLLTLTQRLGRLDRRGQLSKQAKATNTLPPTMTIIGGSNGKTTQAQLTALAGKIGASRPMNGFEYGTDFFSGAPWSVVVGKENAETEDEEAEPLRPKQAHGLEADDIVSFQSLKMRLLKSQDKVSAWLRGQIGEVSLTEINASDSPGKLIECLNATMLGIIYDRERFAEVNLRPKTAKLRDKNPRKGKSLLKLNRWLLEDAFPNELSTGAKFGVDDARDSATWRVAGLPLVASEQAEDDEDDQNDEEVQTASETSAVSEAVTPLNVAHEARQPADWLNDPLAAITAGPVVVPPLSDAVLKRWAATTPRPSKFLPVHPWLYGLLPDDEGTPLVGVAFRLELDVLQHCRQPNEDDGDFDRTWEKVGKCLATFPPLNSELHFVPLGEARKWLKELPGEQRPALAHFDGEEWTDSILPEELRPNSVIVLPSSTLPSLMDDIIPKGSGEGESQRCWDVFEALAQDGAQYRRTVTTSSAQLKPGRKNETGVYRVPESEAEGESAETAGEEAMEPAEGGVAAMLDETKWKPAGMNLSFAKDGVSFEIRYFKPRRDAGDALDLLPDHLATAAEHGRQLAEALVPENDHIAALLSRTAADHDKGKDDTKWQQAMGNTPSWRKTEGHDNSVLVAKPVIENPGNASGYRHEWGTLWRIKEDDTPISPGANAATEAFLRDLYLHGIAAHHGYFRPSIPDRGFDSPPTVTKQNPLRLEAIERSARLQRQLGYWRLAYLESLVKIADVAASRDAQTEETDDEA
ncbi:MAG: type I-U CRISPR-associated helicase/endonuclease Cas3 [Verrucomicrobiales bacterium]|nr:type I-U CRISPR-associated helicase/endonuclease Cas3 [Verrucomicrobiales bacterium]